jgi:hypothetical protein
MPSEQELADYFSGMLSGADKAAFEEQMLADPSGMDELVAQRRIHTALKAMLDPQPDRIEAGILAHVRGITDEAAVKKVLAHTTQPAQAAQAAKAAKAATPQPAAGKIGRPQPVEAPGTRWWTTINALSSLAAGVAAVLLLIYHSPWFSQPEAPTGRLANPVIAHVRDDSGAHWGARQRPLRWGDALRRETLVLDSGVVELGFRNGATLVAEGPARLDLLSSGQVLLHQGKVSANVPPSAVGFTIDTSAGKIVDRGTRFGVKASPSGLVETHVFEGRVEVTPDSVFKSTMKPLKRDMAMRLDPHAVAVAPIQSDAREFPSAGQVIAEPLQGADFEGTTTVGTDGMPIATGVWSGDSCEVSGPRAGIFPHSGGRMLNFMLTGEGPVHGRETDVWSASEQWQFIDLTSYKEAVENGVTAELSAWFNRVGGEKSVSEFVVVLAAYRGSPEDVKNLWWGHRPEMALAYSQDTIVTDEDPTTWERDEVRFEIPAGANLLLVSVAAAKSTPDERLHGHFADSVSLRLVIPPNAAVHAQR